MNPSEGTDMKEIRVQFIGFDNSIPVKIQEMTNGYEFDYMKIYRNIFLDSIRKNEICNNKYLFYINKCNVQTLFINIL